MWMAGARGLEGAYMYWGGRNWEGKTDLTMLITLFWSNERLVIMIQCNHP